jgi:hypothetical protein
MYEKQLPGISILALRPFTIYKYSYVQGGSGKSGKFLCFMIDLKSRHYSVQTKYFLTKGNLLAYISIQLHTINRP